MTSTNSFRDRFVGIEMEVPLLDGSRVPYLNFDNAASTPALNSVREGVHRFLDYYSSVHRGTGYKSQLSTWAYEQARKRVIEFVGGDPDVHTCIFGKNTTEAANKLARRMTFEDDAVVLVSQMEHHSNDLPFRQVAEVVHIGLLDDGRLDLLDLDRKLEEYGSRVRLLAITGASNVTGFTNDPAPLARKVHAVGGMIFLDCAQLAPHRPIQMGAFSSAEHIDFVALSAHKLYAPFGTGALVGPTEFFSSGIPDMVGGGTVEIVTSSNVTWADTPDRDEAGSPNVIGAIALAIAIQELRNIGMDEVAKHEAHLTQRALSLLGSMDGLTIMGDSKPENSAQRLGVIPFQLEGFSHFLVAAILGYEFGIGVRSGCFCAHPYILHILGFSDEEAEHVQKDMMAGDRREMPGLIRASFGLYNTIEEVERFAEAVERITRGDYTGKYVQKLETGEFTPEEWTPEFNKYFAF